MRQSIPALSPRVFHPILIAVAVGSFLAPDGVAQRLYFGVIGGTSATSDFQGRDTSTPADAFGNPANRFQYLTGPRSLIFGALVEGQLTEHFSIEANILHRPMKATLVYTEFLAGGVTNVYTNQSTGVRAWEFPLLLKYTLPFWRSDGRLRPFLEAGPSFRTQEDAAGTEPSRFGVSVGAGAAFQWGRVRIAPTLRYTRWAQESIYPRYATKPDQLEFLTSVAFETDGGSRRVAGRKLEIGAVAGLPLTRGFAETAYSGSVVERTRYLVGLTAQMNVRRDLSVEIDAIYKPLRAGSPVENVQTAFSVVTWQFPVLAKYRWARPRWTPFAEAGPSFRLAGNLNGYNPSHYGITLGGGVETRAHGIRMSPTLRYTRWAADSPPYWTPRGIPFDYSRTNANAIELVFGVSF